MWCNHDSVTVPPDEGSWEDPRAQHAEMEEAEGWEGFPQEGGGGGGGGGRKRRHVSLTSHSY